MEEGIDARAMLRVALEEARLGMAEGRDPDRGGALPPGRHAARARPQA